MTSTPRKKCCVGHYTIFYVICTFDLLDEIKKFFIVTSWELRAVEFKTLVEFIRSAAFLDHLAGVYFSAVPLTSEIMFCKTIILQFYEIPFTPNMHEFRVV